MNLRAYEHEHGQMNKIKSFLEYLFMSTKYFKNFFDTWDRTLGDMWKYYAMCS
jgi:hypothetical protein